MAQLIPYLIPYISRIVMDLSFDPDPYDACIKELNTMFNELDRIIEDPDNEDCWRRGVKPFVSRTLKFNTLTKLTKFVIPTTPTPVSKDIFHKFHQKFISNYNRFLTTIDQPEHIIGQIFNNIHRHRLSDKEIAIEILE